MMINLTRVLEVARTCGFHGFRNVRARASRADIDTDIGAEAFIVMQLLRDSVSRDARGNAEAEWFSALELNINDFEPVLSDASHGGRAWSTR